MEQQFIDLMLSSEQPTWLKILGGLAIYLLFHRDTKRINKTLKELGSSFAEDKQANEKRFKKIETHIGLDQQPLPHN